ncbi:hypothetical protein EDB85DRAFT_2016217, partial [Lactarius pseudohatsudake]
MVARFFVGHDNQTQSVVVAHQGTDTTMFRSILNVVRPSRRGRIPRCFPMLVRLLTDPMHSVFPLCLSHRRREGTRLCVHTRLHRRYHSLFSQVRAAEHDVPERPRHRAQPWHGGCGLGSCSTTILTQLSLSTQSSSLPREAETRRLPISSTQSSAATTYVTHGNDPVPNLSPRFIEYRHSAGEVHIPTSGEADTVICPGQGDENCQSS